MNRIQAKRARTRTAIIVVILFVLAFGIVGYHDMEYKKAEAREVYRK